MRENAATPKKRGSCIPKFWNDSFLEGAITASFDSNLDLIHSNINCKKQKQQCLALIHQLLALVIAWDSLLSMNKAA